jgi:hypothetical protein
MASNFHTYDFRCFDSPTCGKAVKYKMADPPADRPGVVRVFESDRVKCACGAEYGIRAETDEHSCVSVVYTLLAKAPPKKPLPRSVGISAGRPIGGRGPRR